MTRLPVALLIAALFGASVVSAASASPGPSHALADTAWADCGTPVATGPLERITLLSVADGGGGAFIVWQQVDPVSLHADLYAQHLDEAGVPFAGWPANGLALTTAAGDQFDAVATSDGAGGLLVAWSDDRADSVSRTDPDIYALRVDAAGAVIPGWNAGGTRLTVSHRAQQQPAIAPDGAGGVFVAWAQPAPGGSVSSEIVVQHVPANGAPSPGWPDSGLAIATGPDLRGSPTAVTDGAGGSIVAWFDGRGADNDIYAQRVDGAGAALWAGNGVLACGGTRDQLTPRGVPDGAGGIVLAIQDLIPAQFNSVDVMAQRLNASGAVATGWPAGGVAICRAGSAQVNHRIASDAAGGACVSWDDYRSGASRSYVHHVLGSGALAAGWSVNGISAASGTDDQYETDLAADGAGGALAAWTNGAGAVTVKRFTSAGTASPGWPDAGVTLCSLYSQFTPSLSSDGFGGVIVAFLDGRAGAIPEIYASRLTSNALVPALLALARAEFADGSVRLRWYGAEPGAVFELWRATGDAGRSLLDRIAADGDRGVRYDDAAVRAGERLRYRLHAEGGEAVSVEIAIDVPLAGEAAALSVSPNPSAGAFTVSFVSPRTGRARLELTDIGGRRVWMRDEAVIAGAQRRIPGGDRGLAPGVYTIRLTLGGWSAARRLCVMR